MGEPTPDDHLRAAAGDLVFVDFGDVAAAAEVVDRLSGLDGVVEDRFAFENTYGEALLKAGRPGAARSRLDTAFELRTSVPAALRADLSWTLARAGRRQQARRALEEYCATWDDPGEALEPLSSDLGAAAMTALWLGDLATLERAVAMPDEWSQTDLGRLCLNALRAGGLGDVFAGHQETVVECLGADQYWVDVLPDIEDGEESGLVIMVHFLDAERETCRAVEERLFDALDAYHKAHGRVAGAYLTGFFNHVVSLPGGGGGR
jgi:hypothetical protein